MTLLFLALFNEGAKLIFDLNVIYHMGLLVWLWKHTKWSMYILHSLAEWQMFYVLLKNAIQIDFIK